MSIRTNFAAVAAVIAVVAAGLAWRVHHRVTTAQIAVAAADEAAVRIDRGIRQARNRLADAERRRVEIQAKRDATPGAQVAPGPLPPENPPVSRRVRVQDDPAVQAMNLKRFKAGLILRYGSFYRALGFSPEQIDRLETLLTEQQGARLDLTAVAASRGLPSSDPVIATLRRENAERFKAEQIALLGEAGFARLEEYNRNEDRRVIVRRLVGDTVLSAEPLSPTQARQLDAALTAQNFKGVAGADQIQWDAVLMQARHFLSVAQLATLQGQAMQSRRQNAMNELSRLIDAAKK